MEQTALEKNYKVEERANNIITDHGSMDKALRYLRGELAEMKSLWSSYSCDCLGHGITCTTLLIDWITRLKNNHHG